MIVISILSYLITLLTFLPLVKDNYWLFRTLEYPRFQKLIIVLILLGVWISVLILGHRPDIVALILLSVCAIYLSVKIFPYTVLSKKEVVTLKHNDQENAIKIFTANVFQDNKDFDRLLSQIHSTDPDLILLLETNKDWLDATIHLKQKYPYTLAEPLENTYGLLLYSRFKFESAGVVYLVKNDIPSVDIKVCLPSGIVVQLFGLHPEPPVPGESLRTTAKDKELMNIASKAKGCSLPCIVMGDLNDVAWSYTTSLFTKISELLDVRCGRGFYSTFSAKSRFLRFPLDYIFCSEHFGLFKMQRLPYNGSDHFPIFTHLIYRKDLKFKQKKQESADNSEKRDALEMVSKKV